MNGFGVVTNRHVPISVSFLQGSGLLAQQYMFPACPGKPHGAWGIRRRGRETAPKVPVHCGDQTQATKHGRHCYDLHLGMSCYVFAAKSSDEYFGSNSLPFYPLPDSYSRVTSCTLSSCMSYNPEPTPAVPHPWYLFHVGGCLAMVDMRLLLYTQ